MRVALVWPRPRAHRWQNGQTSPTQFPDGSDAFLFLENEGIEVVIEDSCGLPFNPLVRMHEFYSGLDPLRAMRIVRRLRRYDAAICVGDASACVLMWLRDKFGFTLPIVLVDPALSHDYPRRKRLQDYVLPRAARVIVYGRAQLDYLQQEYGSSVHATFMHHRADVEFYRPQSEPPTGAAPYILSVGNDVSRDFDTLARAAATCRADGTFPATFVIQTTRMVDDPGGALDLRRATISYPELRSLYAAALVVVLPLFDKIHAGGINTLLEAMAMGCPLVVSASRGITDYVTHGENALVVGVNDASAMAEAIASLVGSPAEARRLGDNARRFVVEYCDNRLYAKAVAALVREVAQRPRSGSPVAR
jgi:glycosyltransferase involved in cell wall biosynthesis